jgi:Holliday junction resolvasome RuvABC endonuclease subunit
LKNIGFNFTTNDFRYCVIKNDNTGNITLLEKHRIAYPKTHSTVERSGWLETQISLLLDKHSPNKVGHKLPLVLKATKTIQNSIYPLGILNLCCHKRNISITHFTSQAINGSKLALTKKDDVYEYVDSKLGKHPPHWDKATKDALLSAWFLL